MLGIATAIKRKLRRYMWFWGTMIILAALHVLLVLLVPWTPKWIPALVVILIGIADLYVMLWIVSRTVSWKARVGLLCEENLRIESQARPLNSFCPAASRVKPLLWARQGASAHMVNAE